MLVVSLLSGRISTIVLLLAAGVVSLAVFLVQERQAAKGGERK